MNFRTALFLLPVLFCSSQLFAQDNDYLRKWHQKAEPYHVKFDTNLVHRYRQHPPKYYLAEVGLDGHSVSEIARLGIETEHAEVNPAGRLVLNISLTEKETLQQAGFELFNVQPAEQLNNPTVSASAKFVMPIPNCLPITDNKSVPQGFRLGSQNGHFTYLQILEHLDTLHARFPSIISERFVLDSSIKTHEGNYIYGVKVTAPNMPVEGKPEVLFTGVHHAREPLSASNLIYFLYYIGENYLTDPAIQRMVYGAELYFVPCINVDGYIYNELTQPQGGGMWRKNLMRINGEIRGVDLNRNYANDWGKDEAGSSSNSFDETYRGEAPFSEPETQTMRNFCKKRKFRIALNYHAFANALLTPTRDMIKAEDTTYFNYISKVITSENQYAWGSFIHALGYFANGTSDDFMYRGLDQPVYAFTPEIGSSTDNFWPPRERILPLCAENVTANINTVLLLLDYNLCAVAEGLIVPLRADKTVELNLKVLPLGLSPKQDSIEVRFVPKKNITTPEQTFRLPYNGRNRLSEKQLTIRLVPDFKNGDKIEYDLITTSGLVSHTWAHYCGIVDTFLYDPFNDLKNWRSPLNRWQIIDRESLSPPSCLADSPNETYPATGNLVVTNLRTPVKLQKVLAAELRFQAKWDFAPANDFAQVKIVDGSGEATVMCGRFTDRGTRNASEGQPLYAQRQGDWVYESMDLTPFKDQNIGVELSMMGTGVFGKGQGFRMDDFLIHVIREGNVSVNELLDGGNTSITLFPNPSSDAWTITGLPSGIRSVEVVNALGQTLRQDAITGTQIQIQARDLPTGVYLLKFRYTGGADFILKAVRY